MARKPIIGITPTPSSDAFDHGSFHRFALADTYTTAVEAAGGVPIIIPPQEGNIAQILDLVDGLIISGGGDIEPSVYGQSEIHPKTGGIDAGRDSLELALVHGALERDLPMLCICRGIQVLNVALGGDLYQDVPDLLEQAIDHAQQGKGVAKEEPFHPVDVVPGTLLETVYGDTSVQTNSFHHQGLRAIAPQLRVAGTTSDGLVEAVDHPGQRWVLGVQWHPEMMYRAHAEHRAPFEALMEAARKPAVTA